MAITQAITDLPVPAQRGVDIYETFVTKQETFQDALYTALVPEINTFGDQANALKTEMNSLAVSAGISADTVGTWSIAAPYSVATVADLATIDPLIYTTAIVKDLDRGGTFIWSSTGTANGGTMFAGATGFWTRQYSGAVNVKWFGAKGDGVTDDKAAIQSTINFIAIISGGTIIFPFGIYNISSMLDITNSNTKLVGVGSSEIHDAGTNSATPVTLKWVGTINGTIMRIHTMSTIY